MNISIIVATAKNGAIGNENKLLYWLPNDLKRFKALTTGNTIIMGRKTFESLPKGALPNRRNIVLSRTEGAEFPGAEHFTSLDAALNACREDENVFIIGGETLYREALSRAGYLYLTTIDDTPQKADAFFPEIDYNEWDTILDEPHGTDEKHALSYRFLDLKRKQK
jgi:dihydrofolate reductase